MLTPHDVPALRHRESWLDSVAAVVAMAIIIFVLVRVL
jgi:hypothetical protein